MDLASPETTATHATGAVPALRLRLPGEWRRIDLATEASSRRDCARLVDAVAGASGAGTGHRARLRERIELAAAHLRATGAVALALTIRLGPAAPLPCSLIIGGPQDMPGAAHPDSSSAWGLDGLEGAFRTADPDGVALRRVPAAGSLALRRHRVIDDRGSGPGGCGGARRLHAEYWLPVPGTPRCIPVIFGTPLAEISGLMLGRFDAIVATARLEHPGSARDTTGG